MYSRAKAAIPRIIICLFCMASIVLCGIFVYDRSKLFYYLSISALIVSSIAFCAVDAEYTHLSRTLGVIAATVILAVVCYILYYTLGLDVKFGDFESVKSMIVDSGYFGYAVFIALTVFQVVVLPVPAAVTIVIGSAIYGATVSFVLSVIGTVIGSLIAFALGKIFGRRLCNWMFGEENTEKYAKLVGEKGRFLFIIMLLFPAFPDDMLCMIAGITTMSYGYFLIVCVLTRPVMIGVTAYLGSGAIPFEGEGIAIWAALACIMFAAFIIITSVKKRIESRRG